MNKLQLLLRGLVACSLVLVVEAGPLVEDDEMLKCMTRSFEDSKYFFRNLIANGQADMTREIIKKRCAKFETTIGSDKEAPAATEASTSPPIAKEVEHELDEQQKKTAETNHSPSTINFDLSFDPVRKQPKVSAEDSKYLQCMSDVDFEERLSLFNLITSLENESARNREILKNSCAKFRAAMDSSKDALTRIAAAEHVASKRQFLDCTRRVENEIKKALIYFLETRPNQIEAERQVHKNYCNTRFSKPANSLTPAEERRKLAKNKIQGYFDDRKVIHEDDKPIPYFSNRGIQITFAQLTLAPQLPTY